MCTDLVKEQESDSTLTELFWLALSVAEGKSVEQEYLIEGGVLFRKWMSHGEGFVGDSVHQVVIQEIFRGLVLRVAH